MTELNATALIADVRTLAAENPENTAACSYVTKVNDGPNAGTLRPECIMGHALVRAGVDISLLQTISGIRTILENPDSCLDDTYASTWATPEANWLAMVQVKQDGGETWSEAIKSADEKVTL